MAKHKTDWFPGRVSGEYRNHYSETYSPRPGWCECGCKLISGYCVSCGKQDLRDMEVSTNPEGKIVEYEGGF